MSCSSGPNALLVVSYVMNTVFKTLVRDSGGVSRASTHPEILVFLNDLAGNDFNSTFKSLQGFYDQLEKTYNRLGGHEGEQRQQACFVAGIPGSFYGRLFPADSLHFIHSSYIGCLRENDVRSCSNEHCFVWQLVGNILSDMLSQGKVEAEKLESFHVPLYITSSSEEESIILREGSFIINRLETFEVTLDSVGDDGKLDGRSNADVMVNSLRAISEPSLTSHFGEEIIEELFCRLGVIFAAYLPHGKNKTLGIVISLVRQ
ncbi:hypothetical protein C5167_010815 [Papaver somniferum]|uniref:Uncharacterized protein n=1 Tax=Papaver somniferum TaxID=3469 RepID=A0A4Y7K591_PAPSO|nr:hypothetical protein C5167_010815 [Papaver somniferum]